MKTLLPFATLFVTLAMAGVAARPQDALVVSPDAYRLEFENAWVKVVRVTYGPHARIAPHLHTARASAYVYLNDGGPIVFAHEGLPYAGVTRPPTRAGSFRVYKGLAELHAVENPTATPSEFLRVEFKTQPRDEGRLKGTFHRDESAPAGTSQRVQVDTAQVRITRATVAAPGALTLPVADEPALIVALTDLVFRSGGDARRITPGHAAWLPAGHSARIDGGTTAAEVLRFDLKTPPIVTP